MPKLRCSVQTCLHHSHQYCCMGAISVQGKSAHIADETCCNTFCDNEGSMTNAAIAIDPYTEISVRCSAEQCVHNQSHVCGAESIDVNGYSASTAEQTACSSFVSK
ncbi:MAG: hypothetical protein K0S30_1281 [Clostridia bacterium]|nr:hypothetical protein [Clostridia bacterium]